jgi:NADPH-dependent 2,4-dienoyl-CoA reductase/sulfur reductase-like enzyme/rhodanese-related sulfurtransferase
LKIDPVRRSVLLKDLNSGQESELSYDVLVLSPGASPIVPPISGVERALTLRTVEDVARIVDQVSKKPKSAAVIGGGFIGVEIAENLIHRGIKTSMIEASDQVLAPLDPEMASLVAREIRANGVELYLGASAVKIDDATVEISSGEVVAADLVIMAIGVRPDIHLAQDAGLEIGPRKGIKVDEFNLTSDKSIYAIGDVAEKTDSLDGSSTLVPLANIANRHGRIVADHIAGRKIRPVKTIGTAIVKVFDLMIATTGWNEKKLKATSRAYRVIHAHPNSHAGYYPDAKQMTLKLIFDPLNGEILGAQGVGVDGVDKRLDVISTAIRGGIKAQELADLELAYAPPFGSAKDPVNMLGYIAENVISGLVETAQWDQIEDYRAKGYELVDVRTQGEFDRGTIPGAINVPVDEIRERAQEFQGKNLLVTCQVGQRGHTASLLLKSLGFNPVNLDGGYLLWSNSPAAKELVQKK